MYFAVPDDIHGEIVDVAITRKGTQTAATKVDIKKWLRQRISGHKVRLICKSATDFRGSLL